MRLSGISQTLLGGESRRMRERAGLHYWKNRIAKTLGQPESN